MTDQVQSPAAGAVAPTTANVIAAPAAPTAAPTSADAMMAQALVAGGHWTEAQAAAALAATERNEGEEAPAHGEQPAETAEPFNRYAAVADMKSTLAAVGIEGKDAGAAEYIVKRGLERAPTPEQNTQESHEVQQALEGLYGSEKAGWMVEWARREFQPLAAANPKLVDLAERSGAGNSLALIQQLANRGMIRYNKARFGK